MDLQLERDRIVAQNASLLCQTIFLAIAAGSFGMGCTHYTNGIRRTVALILLLALFISQALAMTHFFLESDGACRGIYAAGTALYHVATVLVTALTTLQAWGKGRTSTVWRFFVLVSLVGYISATAIGYSRMEAIQEDEWGGCRVQVDEVSTMARNVCSTIVSAALLGQSIHRRRIKNRPALLQGGWSGHPDRVDWGVPWYQTRTRPTGFAALLFLSVITLIMNGLSCGFPTWDEDIYFPGIYASFEAIFVSYYLISIHTAIHRRRTLESSAEVAPEEAGK